MMGRNQLWHSSYVVDTHVLVEDQDKNSDQEPNEGNSAQTPGLAFLRLLIIIKIFPLYNPAVF